MINTTEFSGTLWQRVRFERVQETPDGYGGKTRVWVTLDTRWAAVVGMAQPEASYAGRVATLNRYQITLRANMDFDLRWRCVWNNRKLAILSINRPQDALDRIILITEQEREQ